MAGGGPLAWLRLASLPRAQYCNVVTAQRLLTMAGDTLFNETVDGVAAANSSQIVWQGVPVVAPDRVLLARCNELPDNRHFFAPLKDLPLLPDIHVEAGIDAINISARRYTFGIGLYSESKAMRFSDNFFDLASGESRTVQIEGGSPPLVTVRSIYNLDSSDNALFARGH